MNEKQWHEWRRQGIGGSDIGVIMGYSKYCSPLELYRIKIGEVEPSPTNALAQLGKDNESSILDWFEDSLSETFKLEREEEFTHPDENWRRGSLDAYFVNGKGYLVPIDAKYSNCAGWGDPTLEQVPIYMFLQMHWYMMILSSEIGYIIKRHPQTGEFTVYPINKNEALQEKIEKIAHNFWHNHVLKKVPPPATHINDLKYIYADTDKIIKPTEEIKNNIHQLRTIKEKLKPLDKEKKELETIIKLFMGDASIIDMEEEKSVKYNNTTASLKFDTNQFKLDQPDLYEKYLIETTSRRFYA